MSPQVWGACAWKFCHAATLAYEIDPTPEQKQHATMFFRSLGHILPCKICRRHYMQHIRANPPRVESRESLSKWFVEVHNSVNRMRGEKEYDYDTVVRHYTENSGECNGSSFDTTKALLLIVSVAAVVLLIQRMRMK